MAAALEFVDVLITLSLCDVPFRTGVAVWTFCNTRDALLRAVDEWSRDHAPPCVTLGDCYVVHGVLRRYAELLGAVHAWLCDVDCSVAVHLAAGVSACVAARDVVFRLARWCYRNARWGLALPPVAPCHDGADATSCVIRDLLLLDLPCDFFTE